MCGHNLAQPHLSRGGHPQNEPKEYGSRMTASRRQFLQSSSLAAAAVTTGGLWDRAAWGADILSPDPLSEFGYGDVLMASDSHESQLMTSHAVLMALSEDSLLKPLRQMSGMPAPGENLGGWYDYDPGYDYRNHSDYGFAPACTFGQ